MGEPEIHNTRLPEETVLNFTRQLQALLAAGLPLYKSIQIIHSQAVSQPVKNVLAIVNEQLAEGKELASALELFPKSFSPFYINMIKVGERHGKLDQTLGRIYTYLEINRENKQKIINSLTYPIILIICGIAVLLLMIVFVLPRFIEIFAQSNIALPLPTRILLGTNNFIQNNYPWILTALGGISIFYYFLNKHAEAKYYFDRYKLQTPVLGHLLLTIATARFCRTLGVLYQGGVQLLECLELSKPTLGNKVLEAEINNTAVSVRNGKGISQPLAESKYFPLMMTQMIAVGEQTGALDKLLLDIASYYELEIDFKIKKLLSLIEPLALIFISILVAFIASAIMLPLFRMAGAVRTF